MRGRSANFGRGRNSLRSVERTLDVLELLGRSRSVGVTELSDALGVAASTAHRMLSTLERKGFASQERKTGRYGIGCKVFELVYAVVDTEKAMEHVGPALAALSRLTGENASYGIIGPDRESVLILAEEISGNGIVARPALFSRIPLHASSCGKAYLMTLRDSELEEFFSGPRKSCTGHTVTSLPEMRVQLDSFRTLGYALSRDEYLDGLSSMAAGIAGFGGRFRGAVMLSGPSSRFTGANIRNWGGLLLCEVSKIAMKF